LLHPEAEDHTNNQRANNPGYPAECHIKPIPMNFQPGSMNRARLHEPVGDDCKFFMLAFR